MANLTNCQLCGQRSRYYELRFFAGKHICPECDEDVFNWFRSDFDREAYVRTADIHIPLDIFGKPMEANDHAHDH
jgi:hypothetical protein